MCCLYNFVQWCGYSREVNFRLLTVLSMHPEFLIKLKASSRGTVPIKQGEITTPLPGCIKEDEFN